MDSSLETRPNDARGFTLIEIVIVVAIIAIVATIVTAALMHGRAGSRVSASEANLRAIAAAESVYFSDELDYLEGQSTSAVFGTRLAGGTILAPNGQPYTITVPTVPPAEANNVGAEVFIITDPGTYDSSLLAQLPMGDSTTGSSTGAACGTSCTHLAYSKQSGVFGY